LELTAGEKIQNMENTSNNNEVNNDKDQTNTSNESVAPSSLGTNGQSSPQNQISAEPKPTVDAAIPYKQRIVTFNTDIKGRWVAFGG
jgi:hypothetical protein